MKKIIILFFLSCILTAIFSSCLLNINPITISPPAPLDYIYTITYYANGASGTAPVDTNLYAGTEKATTLECEDLLYNGYAFAGWTTCTDGPGSSYAAGASFTMPSTNVSLYAVWISNSLSYNSTGSSIIITGFKTAITGSLIIPCGVTEISNWSFYNNNDFTNLILPASIISIDGNAFQACVITNLTIGSVADCVIGDSAFYGCNLLSNIIIPSGIIEISGSAFKYCNLTNATFINSNCSISDSTVFLDESSSFSITAPGDGSVQEYCAENGIIFN